MGCYMISWESFVLVVLKGVPQNIFDNFHIFKAEHICGTFMKQNYK